jgi:hypothetical protein
MMFALPRRIVRFLVSPLSLKSLKGLWHESHHTVTLPQFRQIYQTKFLKLQLLNSRFRLITPGFTKLQHPSLLLTKTQAYLLQKRVSRKTILGALNGYEDSSTDRICLYRPWRRLRFLSG